MTDLKDGEIEVTQWDKDGKATVTRAMGFRESYPGQIDDMIGGIESGLTAEMAYNVYKHKQP